MAAIILLFIAMTGNYVLTNHIINRIGNTEQVGSVQSQLQAERTLTNVSVEAPNTRLAEIESDIIATDIKVEDNADSVSQLDSNVSSFSDRVKVMENTHLGYEKRFNFSVTEIESDIFATDKKVQENVESISQLHANVSFISNNIKVFEETRRGYEKRLNTIATEIESDLIATDTKFQGNTNRITQLDSNVSPISSTMQVLENTQRGYEKRLNTSVKEIGSDIIATDTKVQENADSISQLDSNVTAISDTMHVLKNTQLRYENRVSDIESNLIATDTEVQENAESISQLGSNISSINSTVQDLITKHRAYEIMVNTNVAKIESDKIDSDTKLQGNVDRVSELERDVSSISFNMDDIEKLVQLNEKRLTALEGVHIYSFHVLRRKTVTYKGYQFLVLEVRVPANGLSMNKSMVS